MLAVTACGGTNSSAVSTDQDGAAAAASSADESELSIDSSPGVEPEPGESDGEAMAPGGVRADEDDDKGVEETSEPEATAASIQPEDEPALPVTVIDETGDEITITSVDRIIPLDGTVAEVVFALGLGANVVATDLSATYPDEADALPEIGYQRALSAEPIATFEPTVLLATDIAGPAGTLDDLRTLGYPVIIVPNDATADGPGEKIRAVAAALGVPGRGEALAGEVDRLIEVTSDAGDGGGGPRVAALYIRGTSAQLVLGRDSATHWLIAAAGGVDVADELDLDESAPVTAEAILRVDPEVLLVPAAGLASVDGIDGLLEIAGLGRTSAGLTRRVLSYDDQLLLGNGPRAGELLAELRAELAAVPSP